MIEAIVTPIDATRLQLDFVFPDKKTVKAPIIVGSKKAAQMQLNHEAKVYIALIWIEWLNQRINHFEFTKEDTRLKMAESLIEGIKKQTTLEELTANITKREATIRIVAPGVQSRFYKTWSLFILPVLLYCKQFQGGKV